MLFNWHLLWDHFKLKYADAVSAPLKTSVTVAAFTTTTIAFKLCSIRAIPWHSRFSKIQNTHKSVFSWAFAVIHEWLVLSVVHVIYFNCMLLCTKQYKISVADRKYFVCKTFEVIIYSLYSQLMHFPCVYAYANSNHVGCDV